MRITDIKPHVLSTPLENSFAFSQGWVHSRSTVVVEIITDEGITGWGECLCHGLQPPEIAAAFIQFKFRPMLLGRDPFDVEVLWEEMYNATRPFGQGAAVNAISGVDIALWDVIGRTVNQPVCKLLGGAFRSEVRPYATGFYRIKGENYPEHLVEEAKSHISRGLTAMKLKIGFGIKEDLESIFAVREAVGANIMLMADANCAYNAANARRLLLESESAQLNFLEELLAPEDLEGYKSIRHLSKTYVAAGENIFGKIGYRQWISQGALDILQPDLCSSGGFTECKKIAAMAQAYNTMLIPHVWGSGIGLAASLQFIASLPPVPLSLNAEEPMLEYDQSAHPFREDLIYGSITMHGAKVKIPTAPGIGVEVNRDVINEYRRNVFQ
ncbi:mandelate racemase/muconate lactonizing enzyme family protein [Alicyclobacillus fastidiosus]|uniref:Mandelate racemase/muconate lactonizing enzyme family protein n=1 Tax=Alicyclobacillus fastidiosus TaxID=392011 RepID=A0ABY6ZK11_9BACL|nr:mandelate racemase/muconate lactonizing enzyme family protein [Alicyclobacillus fastidiosus]WAH42933.1 mandelate racemase/muconate lactonizing enzyme family protein [Alicyclobacillus fastidiosus]GMA64885.1 D-galactarolactone cycloisomerase [Alicyclobacillus fastidiosus]